MLTLLPHDVAIGIDAKQKGGGLHAMMQCRGGVMHDRVQELQRIKRLVVVQVALVSGIVSGGFPGSMRCLVVTARGSVAEPWALTESV